MPSNPVSWFEIYVQDLDRAQAFYQSMLGVTLEALPGGPEDYLVFPGDPTGTGASGGISRVEGMPSGGNSTIVYFECEDCAVEFGRALEAGATEVKAKFSIGDFGFCALLNDPDGNLVGLHSMS